MTSLLVYPIQDAIEEQRVITDGKYFESFIDEEA